MTWILILIGLLPDIIDLIMKIRELINGKPLSQRAGYRSQLYAIAKKHVAKQRSGKYALKTSGSDVHKELQDLLHKLS